MSPHPSCTYQYERLIVDCLLQAAVDQLAELLAEAGAFQGRLPTSISCKSLQQRLEEIESVQQLCEEVLAVEGAVSLLGSGPRGEHDCAGVWP